MIFQKNNEFLSPAPSGHCKQNAGEKFQIIIISFFFFFFQMQFLTVVAFI